MEKTRKEVEKKIEEYKNNLIHLPKAERWYIEKWEERSFALQEALDKEYNADQAKGRATYYEDLYDRMHKAKERNSYKERASGFREYVEIMTSK